MIFLPPSIFPAKWFEPKKKKKKSTKEKGSAATVDMEMQPIDDVPGPKAVPGELVDDDDEDDDSDDEEIPT